MDMRWLEDFIALAETANFTRAAKERHLTQSAFSRRIKSLEIWLGVKLIDRKTYPVMLSNVGEEFLPTAKELVNSLMRTRLNLQNIEGQSTNNIRFAAPHTISVHHLTTILFKLSQSIPNIKTTVHSDDLYDCCDALNNGACDFLMCYRHPNIKFALDEKRFTRIDLKEEKMVPVSIASETGGAKWQLNNNDDNIIPYLAYSPGTYLGVLTEKFETTLAKRFEIKHYDAYAEALKSLALCGAGLAWLPQKAIETELERGELLLAGTEEWHIPIKLSIFANTENFDDVSREIWDIFSKLIL
jgi:DNA-binding transcriptional LysR family regulator